MTDLPKINQIKTMQNRVKELAASNPLLYSNCTNRQEELANFLLMHSEWLLTLAMTEAGRLFCNNCDGHGKFWIVTSNDSGEWDRCTKCNGTGTI